MKLFGLLLACAISLVCASISSAGTAVAPDHAATALAGAPTADPFLAMSEITTSATRVVFCPTGQIDPRCAHGPDGEDCSTPELFIFCHCKVVPQRDCVQNP